MSTLNDIADAIETAVKDADLGLRVYSDPEELPQAPSACVLFRGRGLNATEKSQRAEFSIEVSIPVGDKGWARAMRLLRDYLDHDGARSIEAALKVDRTLGVSNLMVAATRTSGERITQFGDGKRAVGYLTVEAYYR